MARAGAQPTLTTARLVLRPLASGDGADIQRLAGRFEVAGTTANIPHPYPDGAAEAWISKPRNENELSFAIVLRESGELAGGISMIVNRDHQRAEIGYYVGVAHWGHGYATEAGRALVRHGFEELALNRVHAEHFTRNPASGRVLQKIGMRHEGTQRKHLVKWGEPIDVELYGIVRDEWDAGRR